MRFILTVDILKLIEKLMRSETPEFTFSTDVNVEVPEELKDKDIIVGLD